MSVGSAGRHYPLTARGEIEEARRHLKNAEKLLGMDFKSQKWNRQRELHIITAYEALGLTLRGWKESSVTYE